MTTKENLTREPLTSITYLYHYGLQEDPFSSACSGKYLYLDPDRKQFLDMLIHLSQYGEQSLLITGIEGSGKTCLLEHFLTLAEPHWKICQIDAKNTLSAEDLFHFIVTSFGLTENPQQTLYPAAPSLDELTKQLINICQHQIPLLVIDNAHALSTDALEIILHLSNLDNNGRKLISALLFSQPEINNTFEAPRFSGMNTLQPLEVPALNKEHTERYTRHRLMMAGYQGKSPLSKRQFRKLHRDSGGHPGQINILAQKALIQKSSTNKEPEETNYLYKFGVISLTMLGILSLTAILVFQQDINQLLNTSDTQAHTETRIPLPLPMVNESEPLIMAAASPAYTTNQLAPSNVESPEILASNNVVDVSMDPIRSTPQEQTPQTSPSQPPATTKIQPGKPVSVNTDLDIIEKAEKAVSITPLPAPVSNNLHDNVWLRKQQDNQYSLQLLATHRKAGLKEFANRYQLMGPLAALTTRRDKEDTVHILVQGQYGSRQEALAVIKSLPDEIQRLSPWPRQIGQLKTTLITPTQAKLRTGPVEALKGAAWLWSRDPGQYTIQLIGADNRQAIVAFSKTLKLTLPLAYFRTQRNNKPWHILVYGEFNNEKAALKVIKQLPTHLRKEQPWPKAFSSVHEALSELPRQE